MNLYLDTSALVKRYLFEIGSSETVSLMRSASLLATAVITRGEVAGMFSKAASQQLLDGPELEKTIGIFRKDWPLLIRIRVTERIVREADYLALQHHLRGYDAVHLTSALNLRDRVDYEITFATFDDRLWNAAASEGLTTFPRDLPSDFLRLKK